MKEKIPASTPGAAVPRPAGSDESVSPAGVQRQPYGLGAVRHRRGLHSHHKRLFPPEQETQVDTYVLSKEQLDALMSHCVAFCYRHVDVSHAPRLVNLDTFQWSTLTGAANAYVQLLFDILFSRTLVKACTSQLALTACDLFDNRVLPSYETLDVSMEAVPTDNGRQFFAKLDAPYYELLLALEGIDHRTPRILSLQTDGIVESMNNASRRMLRLRRADHRA